MKRGVGSGDKQGGFFRRVACQVLPLTRLGEGAQALDAPADKFRDWQENTKSNFCARPLVGLRQQIEGSFYPTKEPQVAGQNTPRKHSKRCRPRLLPSSPV